MMVEVGRTMLTQIQKTLRAIPTAIIVEVAIPDACIANVWILSGKTQNKTCTLVDSPHGQLHLEELLLAA